MSLSLVRGPGVFGEVQVYWNITPAVVSEFELISGVVTMKDRQSVATIILQVLRFKSLLIKLDIIYISILPSIHIRTRMHHENVCHCIVQVFGVFLCKMLLS